MISLKKLIQTGLLAVLITNSLFGVNQKTYIKKILQSDRSVIHLIENSRDDLNIQRKEILKKLAEEGKIILGLEGLSQEEGTDPNATIFGFEDANFNNLAISLRSLMHVFHHALYKRVTDLYGGEENDAYNQEFANPLAVMSQALHSINEYRAIAILIHKDADEIAFFNDQLQSNRVLMEMMRHLKEDDNAIESSGSIYAKNIGSNQLKDNFYDNLSQAPYAGDWFSLLQRVAYYNIKQQDIFPGKTFDVCSNLQDLYTDLIQANSVEKLISIKSQIERCVGVSNFLLETDLRTDLFLKNIVRAYQNKAHLNKPFFVIVSAQHIPRLEEGLAKQLLQERVQAAHDENSNHIPGLHLL